MSDCKVHLPKASDEFKILNVSIKKLFNQYDYEIDFSKNNISILIGPNGTGKTTILELLSFVFAPTAKSLELLLTTPFESFAFQMNNGYGFMFEKRPFSNLKCFFEENVVISIFLNGHKNSVISFEDILKDISVSPNRRAYLERHESEFNSRRIDVFFDVLLEQVEAHIRNQTNDCLPDENAFQFIRANRLDKILVSPQQRAPVREQHREVDPLSVVDAAIKELYSDCLREYNARLTMASFVLPKIYLNENMETMSYEEFSRRHAAYKEKVQKYTDVGLINFDEQQRMPTEVSQPFNLYVDENMYERRHDFLVAYLKTFEVTLRVFDSIYEQTSMFIDIFNERNRLTKKQMRCSTKGITILSNGREIPLSKLSSGEKNDLVIFHELIFGSGEIIFIDEPEISLHIEWQTDFIEQLISICKMNNCQVVLTTHSPYIVNGHNELIAQKQVIENE